MSSDPEDKEQPATGVFNEAAISSEGDLDDAAWPEDKAEPDAGAWAQRAPSDINSPVRTAFRRKVDHIPVEIEVVIGRARVSVAELMVAEPGHQFRLDRRFGEPVDILVNGRLFGQGEIVADRNDAVIGVRMIQLTK